MKTKKHTIFTTGRSIWGSYLIALIFSGALVFSIGAVDNKVWQLVVQTICALLFCAMVYSPAWYSGDHDANAVAFGRIQYDPLKGLKAGLVGTAPFLVFWLIPLLSKLAVIKPFQAGEVAIDIGMVIYRVLNLHILNFVNLLLPPGSPATSYSFGALFVLLLFGLLIPAASSLGYFLGYRHISIGERLIFKNKKKKRPDERRR